MAADRATMRTVVKRIVFKLKKTEQGEVEEEWERENGGQSSGRSWRAYIPSGYRASTATDCWIQKFMYAGAQAPTWLA